MVTVSQDLLLTRAAVVNAPGEDYTIETLELVPPGPEDVLVEMAYAGVCRSDELIRMGNRPFPYPAVTGHEGAGIVKAVGDSVTLVKPGDHVVLNWAISCRECHDCTSGRPWHCSTYSEPTDENARFLRDEQRVHSYCNVGCFSERIVVRKEACIRIPNEIPFDVAALIGCAVATGVGAAMNTAGIKAGEGVAIFGMGGVGLSILLGAKYLGANPIIAVDQYRDKEELTKRFGATHFVTPLEGKSLAEQVRNLTDGRGVTYAFEATGKTEIGEACFASISNGGAAVFVGLPRRGAVVPIDVWTLVGGSRRVLGSLCGDKDAAVFFPELTRLYSEGKLDLRSLISRTYPLGEINDAVRAMTSGKIARTLIKF